jgi:glucosamine--fructose-6-phosphate aminotransferase (isomerizing)
MTTPTSDPDVDPTAPLPGPPDPWQPAPTPSVRSGPPFHMTDMIAAEPALAGRLLGRLMATDGDAAALAAAIRATIAAGEPVVVTGCGTSEHGAMATAAILREAATAAGLRAPDIRTEQAFELSLAPPARGLVIGISHEGGTAATNAALRAVLDAGGRTAVVTVSRRSPAGALATIAVETDELDQGWCHTVGYLSPIVAATAVGAHLSGRPLDTTRVERLVADGTREAAAAEAIATHLADASHLLVIGSGADRPAARELVLKVEEASWLPSAYRDLETFLHGHLPATGASTGLVLVLTDRDRRTERVARARQVLAAAGVIGLRAAAILTEGAAARIDPVLTPSGRLVVGESPTLPAPVAALIGSSTPLQLLTERLARARGTNPDLIRRDDPAYLAAAEAAGG